ncbi:hypothetical protein [Croceitalea rosinachiae]|uniref:Uncharacterized protein n=1 Tax=Croceitalea rosinachiae TaxID=3075596 RepID=A0ABU3AFV5_9FLAO|nr:hypothetical protein [Croceitalea sp. F388]MDT0607756.1 hypothetical protein [Croceitalea sp. F388]
MTARNRMLLTLAATVIGGFSLAVFSKISKDILFDGLSLCSSTSLDITLGSLLLFTSSLLAGFIASIIVVRDNYLPHIFISTAILAKMSFIAVCGQAVSQVWLDTGLSITLILGLWLGYYAALKFPLAPI